MKNLLKNLLTKDMLIIIFINILIDLSWFPLLFSVFVVSLFNLAKEPDPLNDCLLLMSVMSLFIIPRALILPILYNFMEKKSKNEFVQNFIFKLRNSTKFKFELLGYIALIHVSIMFIINIGIYLPYYLCSSIVNLITTNNQGNINSEILDGIINFLNVWVLDLLICIFFGLIFNYLALYLYWFIVDKIKKKKESSI